MLILHRKLINIIYRKGLGRFGSDLKSEYLRLIIDRRDKAVASSLRFMKNSDLAKGLFRQISLLSGEYEDKAEQAKMNYFLINAEEYLSEAIYYENLVKQLDSEALVNLNKANELSKKSELKSQKASFYANRIKVLRFFMEHSFYIREHLQQMLNEYESFYTLLANKYDFLECNDEEKVKHFFQSELREYRNIPNRDKYKQALYVGTKVATTVRYLKALLNDLEAIENNFDRESFRAFRTRMMKFSRTAHFFKDIKKYGHYKPAIITNRITKKVFRLLKKIKF